MSLVKWFRKNNKKVMAVVVIVIMIGFVLGSYLSSLGRPGPRPSDTVAYFLDGKKITRAELQSARQQLDILLRLRADVLLQNQDIQGILLGELLFAESSGRGGSPAVVNYIRQTIERNRYRISTKDISGMYDRSLEGSPIPSSVFWLLLKYEAHRAGLRVANAESGNMLGDMIPKLYQNRASYRDLMRQMIGGGISEEQVLTAFGDLLAILQYGHLLGSNENTTSRQIKHAALRQNETLDVDYVRLDAGVFAKTQPDPPEDKLIQHFNKYKKYLRSTVTAENPYGLGYKLPDRLRLEYIALELDDVAGIIEPPTHEETEQYYQRNKARFTVEVPADPNDPDNLEPSTRIKSYAEVVDSITEQLTKAKINSKAEAILQQGRTMAEPNLTGTDLELENLTSQQFTENARDYKTIVQKLTKEHNLKIYTGLTGLLDAASMQTSKYLGRLTIDGYGYYPVNLTQVVFAVDELAAAELGRFDAPKPRMYETIGPAKDRQPRMFDSSGQIVLIARIVEAAKESEPESIDETFSTHSLVFDPNEDKTDDHVHSTRKEVTEDAKKLAVLETVRVRADEFIKLASEADWDTAVRKFNDLYGEAAKDDPNDPNIFALDYLTSVRRTSGLELNTLAVQNQGSASAKYFLNQAKIEGEFTESLFSLVPPDSNSPAELPVVVEFKPDMSFFCVKNLKVKRLWKEDFDRVKPLALFRQDHVQSQSLAPIHLNPANILKRMKFKYPERDEEETEANEPAESAPRAAGGEAAT